MDLYVDPPMAGKAWSGLLLWEDPHWIGMSHGQRFAAADLYLLGAQKVMVYDWQISKVSNPIDIVPLSTSRQVALPPDEEVDYRIVKEVCAGIGGISAGLAALGFTTIASMDINPFMCASMKANGLNNVLQGDLLRALDRHGLHQTPYPSRGTLCAGFPCQPLSQQGDKLGEADSRALPFKFTLQTMWEQQHGAMLLECVPNALTAPWVQNLLQKLSWSMGCHFQQTVLHLDRSWPCRRTRWWLYMLPKSYKLEPMLDMPLDMHFQRLAQLFPRWGSWPLSEMEELYVPEEHMEKMTDELYGNDIRRLHQQRPCPCILHSYSYALEACPCGCRNQSFAESRLQTAGLRGFYVVDETTHKARYLHVKEAALLCTVDPLMDFGSSAKEKLVLIGQVAAPLQALWTGTYLLESLGLLSHDRLHLVAQYKWHLLRRALQAWPDWQPKIHLVADAFWSTWLQFRVSTCIQVYDLLLAEQRLHHDSMISKLQDGWGFLPRKAYVVSEPANCLILHRAPKRQCRRQEARSMTHTVLAWQDDDMLFRQVSLPSRSFVFEIFQAVDIWVALTGIIDESGNHWRADDQPHQEVTFLSYQHRQGTLLQAAGSTPMHGLTNHQLDSTAKRILAVAQRPHLIWLDSLTCTQLLEQDTWMISQGHVFLGALHGSVLTAVAVCQHWILLEFKVRGTCLEVITWSGLDVIDDSLISRLASRVTQSLALRCFILTRLFWYPQQLDFTCGAVAIQHLGCRVGLWTQTHYPSEDALYVYMKCIDPTLGTVMAWGRPNRHLFRARCHLEIA